MKLSLTQIFNIKAGLALLLCFFSFGVIHAQSSAVTGTVSGEGEPLIGATVLVKGTSNGAITDFDGNYTIEASSEDILIISFLGFIDQEIAIKERKNIDIFLMADDNVLDEIVVIGYGTANKKDITGAVASVKADEIDKIKSVSFEGALAANATGVQVVTSEGGPDAGFKIRVRGGSSINASNDPLYVIDGFAISGSNVSTSSGLGNSASSPLASLDPSTIESIEVLKDASATAIYGSRGANGVVLITTKKGKKGRTDMNFEAWTSVSNLVRPVNLLSAQEFVDWRNEYTPWDPNNVSDPFVSAYRDQFGNDINLNDPRVILTDWQDEISRAAFGQNYKLSMSGGSDNTNYSASFSYLDQEGIIDTSNFERYTLNMNVDQILSDKLKTGINMNVGYINRNGVVSAAAENANGRSGIITDALLFSPAQGLTQFDDAEYDENGRLISLRGGDITNPVLKLQNDINRGTRLNAYANVYVRYEFTDYLTFTSSLRGYTSADKGQAYYSEKYGWGQSANGRAFVSNNLSGGLTTEQNLNFAKTFGDHRVNVTAVYEQQQGYYENVSSSATGFDIPNVNLDNLGTATNTLPNQSTRVDNALKSYLGRASYDYKDRYTLNVSARYDGSSRFAEGNQWGFFPSVGVAWKMMNENFLKNSKFLNIAKIRGSYGLTGNNQIGSYRSLAAGGLANGIFNGNDLATGVAVDRLANPDLTWETTAQFDIGINLAFFNNRISFEADYYNKETSDLLLEVPLPTTSGFRTAFKNLGSMNNRGLEFGINTVNVETDNFTWTSSLNISFNKNEITDLGGADEFFVTAIGSPQIADDYVIRVGESVGSIYGIKENGVYNYNDFAAFDGLSQQEAASKMRADAVSQNIPYYDLVYTLKDGVVQSSGVSNKDQYRPGMPKYQDQNGDGIVNTEDRTIIGNTVPDHFGGFTNNFKYKNFDLSVMMQWSYGNDVYNKNRSIGGAQAIPYSNKLGYVRDRWTPESPNTDIPGIWGTGDAGISGNAYSSYVEDGSYLRFSNVMLGYNLNTEVANKIGLKTVRFYVSADNLYTFTNYTGYDPDVSVGGNQLTPGLDVDSYPRARTFRIGINAGF